MNKQENNIKEISYRTLEFLMKQISINKKIFLRDKVITNKGFEFSLDVLVIENCKFTSLYSMKKGLKIKKCFIFNTIIEDSLFDKLEIDELFIDPKTYRKIRNSSILISEDIKIKNIKILRHFPHVMCI